MQSIEDIYKQYSNTLYKYLLCLTHDEDISEDLVQETFAIAVKEIHKFRGDCKVSVWLCQIAKHLWYKQQKKNRHMSIEELNTEIEDVTTIEETVCNNEEKLRFFKNMQKLDEQSREIMYLKMVGNLNFIEIAEILGKSPNWARVTFFRAKQKIKEVDEKGKKN